MLYVDVKTWLVDELLLKADKMTMAASIELRVPFLDYRLVEAVTALPSQFKINKGDGKFLLKKIMEKYLPSKIIYREKKGFPVPTRDWLKGPLLEQASDLISTLKPLGYFRSGAIDKLLTRHQEGVEDNSKLIMALLVFVNWREQYLS